MKDTGIFWGRKKRTKDFLGYAKQSSDFFGCHFLGYKIFMNLCQTPLPLSLKFVSGVPGRTVHYKLLLAHNTRHQTKIFLGTK